MGTSIEMNRFLEYSHKCIREHYLSNFLLKIGLKLVFAAAAAAKSFQSCLTLWDPIEGSPPGSPVPGILQARILEWVAISFSNAWKWKVKVKLLSRVQLFATPWTAAYQAPPSMRFPRQVYWSGLSLPPPLISYPIRNNYNCRCEEHFVTIENDTLSSRSQKEKEIKY